MLLRAPLGSIPRVFAEYVAGGSLSAWIRACKLYESGHEQALERMLDVAIQFAWGLHYAHEQGLVNIECIRLHLLACPGERSQHALKKEHAQCMLSLVGKTLGPNILDVYRHPPWAEKPGRCMHHLARQSVMENGLLTNPVHVLDLGLYLPAMIITSILLWRRKLLGYLLAVPLLVFSILKGTEILGIFFVMSSKGMPTSLGVEIFFAVIVVVSLVLSVLFLQRSEIYREVK